MVICPICQRPTLIAIPRAFTEDTSKVKTAGLNLILAKIQDRKNHQTVSDRLQAVSPLFIFYHCWNFAVETNSKENNNRIKNNDRLLNHIPVVHSLWHFFSTGAMLDFFWQWLFFFIMYNNLGLRTWPGRGRDAF